MTNYTYKIYTLGCKVNQYDSGRLAAILETAGFQPAGNAADLIIVSTCSVTATAANKSRRAVRKSARENPDAKIIVAGCLPRIDNGRNGIVSDVGTKRKIYPVKNDIEMANIISELFGRTLNLDEPQTTSKNQDRTRYFIKIQDGCEQFCSYCIIPYARGPLKSRGEPEVVKEIRSAAKKGYREIVLSGIHLGLYGRDLSNQTDLCRLLNNLINLKKSLRIRLSSIEITEVTDELIDLIARNRALCRHLHIPLQSGSDRILKLMNRPYTTGNFRKIIEKIRKKIPDIAISTDVIVGFPGETDNEYSVTHDFVKALKFSRLHIFPFSAHKNTKAAEMADKVSPGKIRERSDNLRHLGRNLEINFKRRFWGRPLDIIVEKTDGDMLYGKSEYYFDIAVKKNSLTGGECDYSKAIPGTMIRLSS